MQKQGNHYTLERERVLADGIRDVASELRMIDAVDLVTYIRFEQFANIKSLVNSSTELFFKPGTISFGCSGEVDLKWGSAPSISLDMEFHNLQVSVYFRLLLESLQAGVEILHITFDDASPDPDVNTGRLAAAIADARIAPPVPAGVPVPVDACV